MTTQTDCKTIGGMPAAEYHAAPGLSHHGMKDLAISPLHYWHENLNPDRPEEKSSRECRFGTALHCAVLEPEQFDKRYCSDLTPDSECLVTMEDLRQWLRDKGFTPKGARKAELICQAQAVDPNIQILEVLEAQHEQANAGKTILAADEWARVQNAARALLAEPKLQQILRKGQPEVSMFAIDPGTGVSLKARMDWVTPELTLDLKTFTRPRNKTIDRAIRDAIYYEGYHRQAYFYSYMRHVIEGKWLPFVLAFVESEPPHEVRICSLTGGRASHGEWLYWMTARIEVLGLIEKYADYSDRLGTKSWREYQPLEELTDEDLRQLAYA